MSQLLVGDVMIFSIPVDEKTLVFTLWYSALFWLPVRLICGLIDRHRLITQYEGPVLVVEDSGYRIGMDVEPPM